MSNNTTYGYQICVVGFESVDADGNVNWDDNWLNDDHANRVFATKEEAEAELYLAFEDIMACHGEDSLAGDVRQVGGDS